MDSIVILSLLTVFLLVLMTAFFVGAEFSLINLKTARIDQLILEGNKKAKLTKKIIDRLDYYLSACQLGITLTAIGLGWLGQPAVEQILKLLLQDFGIGTLSLSIISFTLAFAFIAFIRIVFGELTPKNLAVHFAERMALACSGPLYVFGFLMAPFIKLMKGTAILFLRIFGVEMSSHPQGHSEEELKIIMTQSYHSGEINQTELSYMRNIFSFDERQAKDIMLPRTQMETVSLKMDHAELLEIVRENQFTRYPITENGDKDDILGFVNVKEMLTNYTFNPDLSNSMIVHDVPFVHETAPLQNVLLKMQKEHVHMAVVVDEYGGTSGMITMEDILEEIVGEIRDEFDDDELDEIKVIDDDNYMLNGRVLLSDLEERFALSFDDSEDVDTIGGWIQLKNTDISEEESIDLPNHTVTVKEMENHQIIQVLLRKITG